MDFVLFISLLIIATLVYFIPTFVAIINRHKYTIPIFIANIFFGVTVAGWAVLLIFSILKEFRITKNKCNIH
jgi:hypothetical protein